MNNLNNFFIVSTEVGRTLDAIYLTSEMAWSSNVSEASLFTDDQLDNLRVHFGVDDLDDAGLYTTSIAAIFDANGIGEIK